MKVIVGIKRVVDYNIQVRVKPDGSGINLKNIKMSMNPFDEIALEEAIRLKEKEIFKEVIAVSIDVECTREILQIALAMGADRAIYIKCSNLLEPLDIAKILQKIIVIENAKLCLLGKKSIDNEENQIGQMLAGLLKWPQATSVSSISFENNEAVVSREIDYGIQTISVKLPAVITTDLHLNEPRYSSILSIMKARKIPIEELTVEEIGIVPKYRTKILNFKEPLDRKPGIIVKNINDMVNIIINNLNILK